MIASESPSTPAFYTTPSVRAVGGSEAFLSPRRSLLLLYASERVNPPPPPPLVGVGVFAGKSGAKPVCLEKRGKEKQIGTCPRRGQALNPFSPAPRRLSGRFIFRS